MIEMTPTLERATQVAQHMASRAAHADRQGKLPVEDVQALREGGFFALSIPTDQGGLGLSLHECVAAILALAQGSASSALVAVMPLHVFGYAREIRPWPEPMFARMCQAALKDGALFNNVASEPMLGSPSRGGSFETHARPHPSGGWVVNGHKTWTTGGRHITHMLVRLQIEDEPGLMLVRQDTPGVTWEETWVDTLSLRASDSHDVYFTDVAVPAEHLLERGGQSGKTLPNAWFPLLLAAAYLGPAIAARQAVVQYALERVPSALGKPIATLPKIQRQIGEIDVVLQAAQALLFEVAQAWTGEIAACQSLYPRVAAAKHFAIETAQEVTNKALHIAGGLSITSALPLERYFRDVRAGSMQPPSGDTALEIVGRGVLGV
ncbi:MAG: hypothetical protein ETSY1_39520 [Candidatus Entotheonella factor]|uniref:Acyl-CoA dehydrogenase n=1 Tax=Entotheonella factor TaxID=1429438 RepID=W4L671_ENTF1|nr:MAG: hypothetical protein ETSY1_39520 [Candidatus Entotheonella factor]